MANKCRDHAGKGHLIGDNILSEHAAEHGHSAPSVSCLIKHSNEMVSLWLCGISSSRRDGKRPLATWGQAIGRGGGAAERSRLWSAGRVARRGGRSGG